ncbi:polysaccharide deacetylase, partial [Bradyrhizobium genosp. SA-3]
AERPHAAKGKAAKSLGRRTAHAAHGTPKRAAQANTTAPKTAAPRPIGTASLKKRA